MQYCGHLNTMYPKYRTWLELDSQALNYNTRKVRSFLTPKTKLCAVVKSNAYGHGLLDFSRTAKKAGVDGFCVDSAVEGLELRRNGFQEPIIVLGATLPSLFKPAHKNNLTISISGWEFLSELAKSCPPLPLHLKIDTGMHRQGFAINDLPKVLNFIKNKKLNLTGFFSHLAMPNNQTFSDGQKSEFREAENIINSYGFKNLTRHLAATGGILLGKDYHFDLVRCGMGLYGCWEGFKPVLSWHTLISEIKNLKKGDCVGYDLTEKINRPVKAAILPIGYWHGFDRGLSKIGEVFIKNKPGSESWTEKKIKETSPTSTAWKPARVLGRVSMDMIVVDVTDINCKVGEIATLIGPKNTAVAMSKKINTSPYEVVTRINPLIQKITK